MWTITSHEVYAVIFARHRKQLKPHASFSDPTGTGYHFSTGKPEMVTEWGFEDADAPLLKIRQTKENEQQKEWDNEFFLYVAKTITAMLLLISSLCFGQDTIPVYIFADDTTYRPDLWYPVQDAYGDTTITRWSNEYYTTLWGWEIDGDFYAMDFQPLQPKYKVLNSEIREKDLLGRALQPPSEEIVVNGDTTIVRNPERLWFQGEPTVVVMPDEKEPTFWQKIAALWHRFTDDR